MAVEIVYIVEDLTEEVVLGLPPTSEGGGDMSKSTYDPSNKSADAFDYGNFDNTPTTITAQQGTDITTNNAKTGITPTQSSNITTNNSKVGVTTEEANTINSEPIGNEVQVLQIVSITQANYDLLTPVATTIYNIDG